MKYVACSGLSVQCFARRLMAEGPRSRPLRTRAATAAATAASFAFMVEAAKRRARDAGLLWNERSLGDEARHSVRAASRSANRLLLTIPEKQTEARALIAPAPT